MPPKTRITLGNKTRSVPKKYVPSSLSKADRKAQAKSILNKEARPKVKSATTKRSTHAVRFEKKYGFNIKSQRVKSLIAPEGIRQILNKGRGAYYSAGSRPNVTAEAWAYARLASVIMNGPARKVDKAIWDKYRK